MSSVDDALEDGDVSDVPPSTRPDGLYACQRIGCDAYYLPGDTNTHGGCRYHPQPPKFHDGLKSWPCCSKSSTDFGDFMAIPGCAVGAHTLRKPAKVASAPEATASAVIAPVMPMSLEAKARGDDAVARETCARCSAGFYCSEHAGDSGASTTATARAAEMASTEPAPMAPVVGADTLQTCKRPGCGEKYRERDNADDACVHHSGAPIFHEGKKGWSCCGKLVYDFDDFLKIAPCARGRHDATWTLEFQKHTNKAK